MRRYLVFLTLILFSLGTIIFFFSMTKKDFVNAQKSSSHITSTPSPSPATNKKRVASNEETAIKEVIIEYYRLAKEDKFTELKKLVVKAQLSDHFIFKKWSKNEERNKTPKSKSKKPNGETPVLSGGDDLMYEIVTQKIPQIFSARETDLGAILDIQYLENKVKVLVRSDHKGMDRRFSDQQNYLLIKNNKGIWKIYSVQWVVKNPGEGIETNFSQSS